MQLGSLFPWQPGQQLHLLEAPVSMRSGFCRAGGRKSRIAVRDQLLCGSMSIRRTTISLDPGDHGHTKVGSTPARWRLRFKVIAQR